MVPANAGMIHIRRARPIHPRYGGDRHYSAPCRTGRPNLRRPISSALISSGNGIIKAALQRDRPLSYHYLTPAAREAPDYNAWPMLSSSCLLSLLTAVAGGMIPGTLYVLYASLCQGFDYEGSSPRTGMLAPSEAC